MEKVNETLTVKRLKEDITVKEEREGRKRIVTFYGAGSYGVFAGDSLHFDETPKGRSYYVYDRKAVAVEAMKGLMVAK